MFSLQLTHIGTDLLAKGLNFSITFKTLPNKTEADMIRAKISPTLKNFKPPDDNLYTDERTAMEELQLVTSIVTLLAGECKSTLILNREDYLEKKYTDHINNGPYHLKKILLPKSKPKHY